MEKLETGTSKLVMLRCFGCSPDSLISAPVGDPHREVVKATEWKRPLRLQKHGPVLESRACK